MEENSLKRRSKFEESVFRSQSQDPLDTSSASSLSFFTDHNDVQNSSPANDLSAQKSGECSPRASMDEALKSEKAFIEFVMSLPAKESSEYHRSVDSVSIKSKSPVASSSTSKVGLDHLDNLCKLMEQLSELRDTNSKLQKRVQYLEDLKTLHDMHKEICEEGHCSSEDALISKSRRPYGLKKSATESHCPKKDEEPVLCTTSRSPSKYLSRRSRSQTTGGPRRERSKSVGHEDASEDPKSKRIFPKWSKVKEAFGWESERKDSVKMKNECPSNIRTPRRCSDESQQSLRRQNRSSWYQDYESLHSSVEDVSEFLESERWKRSSVASEKSMSYLDTPSEGLRRQKSTPSPGSDKVISYREVADLKPKSSTIERDSYMPQDFKFDKDDGKRGKSPWGRVKTIIERRRDSLKRRSLRRDHPCTDCEPRSSKKTSDASEGADYSEYVESLPKQSCGRESLKRKSFKPCPITIDQEVDCSGPRTPGSSPNFHRKSRWTRVKKVLKGKRDEDRDPLSQSTPASPNGIQDEHFTFDAIEEISQDSYEEGREITRVGSDSHVHHSGLAEPTSDLMLQLQRNLSEDFHRKIREWERMRASGHASYPPHWDRKPSETARSRKKSERYDKTFKPKLKDLTWLEKELQKIEKEKQRLSKERQKYEERATRLEKLKETVLNARNSNKREVLVRTSAGEFRFEGISDAFTKKLYEWETKRGLGPELSTIALLDSSLLTVQPAVGPKSGVLQRVVSRSESSIADIGQPSHNSSNSLPSLKVPDSVDVEKQPHPSRANSEPDLSTLAAFTNVSNVPVSNLTRQGNDSFDDELASPEAGKESEEDELDKRRKDSETYYGLLEENVILLEQLKDKEEICRRLEKELDVLDKKVDVMNEHHKQETERYREKLWEMHKPGATPRDVQCCLHTMSQLRTRIDTLEKYTEKLRNDRESVEDSFRYHSKQQEDMTLDLLEKMRELQAAGSSTGEGEMKQSTPSNLSENTMERLQDLSALLVKQTKELEETLSAKSRQICQLKWELLHRDLSTVKLETELHTHTAHKKRSKYAHHRSRSSEEASAFPLQQQIECSQPNLIPDVFYDTQCYAMPISEITATQLTNTVQQLNREVLKLASAKEYGPGEGLDSTVTPAVSNKENSRTKKGSQEKTKDHCKQITVRRNSADNVSLVPATDNKWRPKSSSSSDSDDFSDDGYMRVSWRQAGRNNIPQNSNAERLLMSYGEHPPRGYPQRRKKAQKVLRCNSSPGRRRSNTFHNHKENPIPWENVPQKCHSFRVTRERFLQDSNIRNNASDSTLNIRNFNGGANFPLQNADRKHIMQQLENRQGNLPVCTNVRQVESELGDSRRWLREVASDSKIPFLIKVQHRLAEQTLSYVHNGKQPIRSMSEKHKRDMVSDRRAQLQKKRPKKRMTSPDLFSFINKSLNQNEISNPSETVVQPDVSKIIFSKNLTFNELPAESRKNKSNLPDVCRDSPSDIYSKNSETATVTIHLPKRKVKKPTKFADNEQSSEQTFTIVMPKKRSLSSEKDSSLSEYSAREISTNTYGDETDNSMQGDVQQNTTTRSLTDPLLCQKYSHANDTFRAKSYSKDRFDFPTSKSGNKETKDFIHIEVSSRKRKAEKPSPNSSDTVLEESENTELSTTASFTPTKSNETREKTTSTGVKERGNSKNSFRTSYIKSPSAPQLDWRKVCAKKVSRSGAPNVRTLIEKYNKVAEEQARKTPISSNVGSPATDRKVSLQSYGNKTEVILPSYSFSTPNTPSIVSASSFYNPLIFKPANLDLFPKTPPASPISKSRSEALKKAKENFISAQCSTSSVSDIHGQIQKPKQRTMETNRIGSDPKLNENSSVAAVTDVTNLKATGQRRLEDDTVSNSSLDSLSLVVFRTGETCKESRLSKRSTDCPKLESHRNETNNLKTSKSLSNSSIFKTVLSSEFRIPASLLKLRRSKRKKDMATVSQLCRQSLLLDTEGPEDTSVLQSHKSCPSSPELKSKGVGKSNWFHRNLFRHK